MSRVASRFSRRPYVVATVAVALALVVLFLVLRKREPIAAGPSSSSPAADADLPGRNGGVAARPRPFALPSTDAAEPVGLPLDWKALQPGAHATEMVRSAAGGAVSLADGTQLQIPPNALSADTPVTVRRLVVPGTSASDMVVTDVDIGGKPLSADAILTVPAPRGDARLARLPRQYKAFHHGDQATAELPVEVDEAKGVARVRTRHFSPVTVALLVVLGAEKFAESVVAGEALTNMLEFHQRDPPLVIPYCAQGRSNWCWAAGTTSMLKAYGASEAPWELARNLNLEFLVALPDRTGHWFQKLDDLYELNGLNASVDRTPWLNPALMTIYLCEQLGAGRPVYLSVYKMQHAIVAVGFNKQGIFVHDPAGTLLHNGGMDVKRHIAEGHLTAVHVPWENFFRAVHFKRLPGMVYTAVVTNKRPTPQPISLMLMHDDLRFTHPTPLPRNPRFPWKVHFTWDGTSPGGVRFTPSRQAPFWDDVERDSLTAYERTTPPYPCNGDRIWLRATVANAGPQPQEVEVAAKIGGWPVGKPLKLQVPPYQSFHQFDLTPLPPGDTPGTNGLTALSGVRLPTHYQPGNSMLVLEAKVAGKVVDHIAVDLPIGPARPFNVKLERKDGKLLIAWEAGEPGPEVVYDVYRVDDTVDADPQPEALASLSGREVAARPGDDAPGKNTWYYVVARDKASSLISSPSDYATLAAQPPPPTPVTPEEGPKGAFQAGDAATVDSRFASAREDLLDRGNALAVSLDAEPPAVDGIAWRASFSGSPAIAQTMFASQAKTLQEEAKDRAARIEANNKGRLEAGLPAEESLTDRSRFDAREAIRYQVAKTSQPGLEVAITSLDSFVLYRDVFLIRYARTRQDESRAQPGETNARPVKESDELAERTRIIDGIKKLIDRRFPAATAPKPPG